MYASLHLGSVLGKFRRAGMNGPVLPIAYVSFAPDVRLEGSEKGRKNWFNLSRAQVQIFGLFIKNLAGNERTHEELGSAIGEPNK